MDRVFDMHKTRYEKELPTIKQDLDKAHALVMEKKVLGSQRALQFGGPSILNKNARMFNCIATFIDRPRVFQETMWLLLCGCGVGFSVQKHHIAKLPDIAPIKENQTKLMYQPEDSIEGWANCLGVLLSCYFTEDQPFPEFFGKDVYFDYSLIRPKGSPISHMGNTAPGYKPLKKAISAIRKLFDRLFKDGLTRLRPVDAYDIICHSSDAVLAGGIRRCLAKGSLVTTKDNAAVPIEDVKVGDMVSTHDGWKPVTNTFVQGEQDTILIQHSGGFLKCTRNHRVAVYNSPTIVGSEEEHKGENDNSETQKSHLDAEDFCWKEAGELNPGDELLFVAPEVDLGSHPIFYTLDPEKCNNTTITNVLLDEEMAFFLGYIRMYVSYRLDNNKSTSDVILSNISRKGTALQFVTQQLRRFGDNIKVKSTHNVKNNTVTVEVFSNDFRKYLFQLFGLDLDDGKTVEHPVKSVMTSPLSKVRAAYLKGLMTSHRFGKRNRIMGDASLKVTQEFQAIASSLGLATEINAETVTTKSDEKSFTSYTLVLHNTSLARFNELCAFGKSVFPQNGFYEEMHAGLSTFEAKKHLAKENAKLAQEKEDRGLFDKFQILKDLKKKATESIEAAEEAVKEKLRERKHPTKSKDRKVSFLDRARGALGLGSSSEEDDEVEKNDEVKSQETDNDEDGAVSAEPVKPVYFVRHKIKAITPADRVETYDIEVEDNHNFLCDGVLVHNSALINVFSRDDKEMIAAKTGNWFMDNPQRGRSNNSALLLRGETTKEQFSEIMKSVKSFGEPGFIWADNTEVVFNPCCVSGDTWVMTSDGSCQVTELIGEPFTAIVDGKLYECKTGFFKSGEKELYTITTESGHEVTATKDHRFKVLYADHPDDPESPDGWKQLGDLVPGEDEIRLHRHSNKLNVNDASYEYADGYVDGARFAISQLHCNDDQKCWKRPELQCLDYQVGFLKGFFRNLPMTKLNSIEYFVHRKDYLQVIQRMLLRIGIMSSIGPVDCDNSGDSDHHYIEVENYCLERYDDYIGFPNDYTRQYVMQKASSNPDEGFYSTVKSLMKLSGTHPVYDCTVEDIHAFDANGFYAHNCEISLYPIDVETGKTGFQACNLTEINMKAVKTEEDFYDVCRASAVLGTLQAGYTNFEYLGEISERIIRKEALLGCSMTGMCDNPRISFNAEVLRKGARIIKDTNKEIAKLIGINPAARTTCIKPAGSSSCILGTSSGIHPAHSHRYFRRVQVNKMEKPQAFFAKHNPNAVKESVWSANKTDNVITFLCEAPKEALTKQNVSALDLLRYVKLVQENWVCEGRDASLCVQPWLQHNVSNTINVNPDEWNDVTDFIYNNRQNFTGISILPSSGDMIYKQAPFQRVYTAEELVEEFGEGVMFSSGLIIHALQAFNDDLFDACSAILGQGGNLDVPDFKAEELEIEDQIDKLKNVMNRRLFVERGKKFARRYFDGDLTKMTFCLKAVNALKEWCDLSRVYKNVPWEEFYEEENNTKIQGTVACAGGACELVRM